LTTITQAFEQLGYKKGVYKLQV